MIVLWHLGIILVKRNLAGGVGVEVLMITHATIRVAVGH